VVSGIQYLFENRSTCSQQGGHLITRKLLFCGFAHMVILSSGKLVMPRAGQPTEENQRYG
jgi:hypothetical protein